MDRTLMLEIKKANEIVTYMPSHETLEGMSYFFSAFSDATRLKILSALSVSEMCVNDISVVLNINQTTVSHQLKLLKSAGLVSSRREGKNLIYFLASNAVNDIMLSSVDYLYC